LAYLLSLAFKYLIQIFGWPTFNCYPFPIMKSSIYTLIDNFLLEQPDLVVTIRQLINCIHTKKNIKHKIIKHKEQLAIVKNLLLKASCSINVLDSEIFSFSNVNVRMKLTTVSPLQFSLKSYSIPMTCVNHIICNVGDMQLYLELFMAMHLCPKLKRFSTLTLLLPASFERKPQRLDSLLVYFDNLNIHIGL
jgi:hypothetical protein